MTDDNKPRHHRTINAVIFHPEIAKMSAVDWRVLHAVEYHQNYRTWKCRLSLARIAKVALCSRTNASASTHRWQKMGFLKIARSGKFNTYEIVRNFLPYPGIVLHTRNISSKSRKRDSRGRYSSSAERESSPYMEHRSSPYVEHTTIDSSSEILEQSSPFPSQREQPNSEEKSGGPLSPLVVRLGPPPERKNLAEGRKTEAKKSPLMPSPETMKKLKEAMGCEKLKTYLMDHGYPLTLLPAEDAGNKE